MISLTVLLYRLCTSHLILLIGTFHTCCLYGRTSLLSPWLDSTHTCTHTHTHTPLSHLLTNTLTHLLTHLSLFSLSSVEGSWSTTSLVAMAASNMATSVADSGHMFAIAASCSSLTPSANLSNEMSGLPQVLGEWQNPKQSILRFCCFLMQRWSSWRN